MNDPVIWAMILLAVAAGLFLVEASVPSGGAIGVMAAISLVAGIVMLFKVNTTTGLIGALLAVGVGVPGGLLVMLKVSPNTPFMRTMTHKNPKIEADAGGPGRQGLPKVDATGHAVTDLRPVGSCLIDGRRHECLAAAGMIRVGAIVRVVSVDETQIKVREEA